MDQKLIYIVFGGLLIFAGSANIYGATNRMRKKNRGNGKGKDYNKSAFIKDKTTSYHLLVGLWMIFSTTAIILTVYGCKAIFLLGKSELISTTIALVLSALVTLTGLGLHIIRKRRDTIYSRPLGYHDNIRLRTELSVFLSGWQTSVVVAAISVVVIMIGDFIIAVGVFFVYVLWLAIAVIGRTMNINKIVKLYKNNSPDALVKYYKTIAQQSSRSEVKAALTIKTVMAYGFYGQMEKAEKALSDYKWSNAPVSCCFYEKSGKAILSYLKNVYHVDGFIYSQKAMDELRFAILSYDDSYFSRTKKSKDRQLEDILLVQNSLLQIGELLTHNYDAQIIDSLEAKYRCLCNNHISHSLLIAGCLAKIYGDIGIRDKKQKMEDYCSTIAPYCKTIAP